MNQKEDVHDRSLVLLFIILILIVIIVLIRPKAQAQPQREETMATTHQRFTFQPLDQSLKNTLNSQESRVIIDKGTERAFTGIYTDTEDEGTYYCRWCNSPLYSSQSKFHSGCGWPSFDDEIPAVERRPDADGNRTEIVCATCQLSRLRYFGNDSPKEYVTASIPSLWFSDKNRVTGSFSPVDVSKWEHLFERQKVYSAVADTQEEALANPAIDVLAPPDTWKR